LRHDLSKLEIFNDFFNIDQIQMMFRKLSIGLFASAGQIFWNRFTGPGKVALQSMYYYMKGGEQGTGWQLKIDFNAFD
jgi:hypothetical protein